VRTCLKGRKKKKSKPETSYKEALGGKFRTEK
jgi:hypothetical protein